MPGGRRTYGAARPPQTGKGTSPTQLRLRTKHEQRQVQAGSSNTNDASESDPSPTESDMLTLTTSTTRSTQDSPVTPTDNITLLSSRSIPVTSSNRQTPSNPARQPNPPRPRPRRAPPAPWTDREVLFRSITTFFSGLCIVIIVLLVTEHYTDSTILTIPYVTYAPARNLVPAFLLFINFLIVLTIEITSWFYGSIPSPFKTLCFQVTHDLVGIFWMKEVLGMKEREDMERMVRKGRREMWRILWVWLWLGPVQWWWIWWRTVRHMCRECRGNMIGRREGHRGGRGA